MLIFLASDIEGSTRLWEAYPQQMPGVLARHDALLRSLVEQHGGQVVKHTGDGIFAVFASGSPFQAALDVQRQIAAADWSPLGTLRVRLALHAGEADVRGGDFFGLEVNRTFRLLAAGWGEQILLSGEAAHWQGDPAAVLPQGAALLDHGEQLLKDLRQPLHIYELRSQSLPERSFPGLRTLTHVPNNLPTQPTAFLGRQNELAQISRQLGEADCRLLTLTGPGGIGKTRLALQAAAENAEHFAQGIFLVALAPLSDPQHIVPAIAEATGFTFYGQLPPQQQLVNYLREKHLLLVLDNFEHLMAGVDLLTEILASAPHLKVLATSRERLNLQQEWVLEVGGMPLPSASAAPAFEQAHLQAYPALQLFWDAARRSNAGFDPNLSEQACILRICHHLEGLPLGIELAAAWVHMLSCQEIAAELEKSLDFLSTRQRNRPDRQRSLRAVFDYSWALLEPVEQNALARLAVLSGEFERAGAQAVANANLGVLAALVEKSLVRREPSSRRGGQESFRLHAALRPFALEQLSRQPAQEAETRQRHADYFLKLAAKHHQAVQGAGLVQALEEIGAQLENIRQAWHWALKNNQAGWIGPALEALMSFFFTRSRFGEARQLLQAALVEPAALEPLLRLRLQIHLVLHQLDLYQHAGLPEQLAALLAEARSLKLPQVERLVLYGLARLTWMLSDYEQCAAYARQSLALAGSDAAFDRALALNMLGVTHWATGQYDQAYEYCYQAMQAFSQLAQPYYLAISLDRLGVVLREMGRYAEALPYLHQALEAFEQLGSLHMQAYVHNHLSSIYASMDQDAETIQHLQAALNIARQIGERRSVAYNLADLGSWQQTQGQLTEAYQNYTQAEELFQAVNDPFGRAYSLLGLAGVQYDLANPGASWELYQRCLAFALENELHHWISAALANMALHFSQRGQWAEALAHALQSQRMGNVTAEYQEWAAQAQRQSEAALPPSEAAQIRQQTLAQDEKQWVAGILASANPWANKQP